MKKIISMLEFRHHAEEVIDQVRKGQTLILTYRGKPVARLEPIRAESVQRDDPFYALDTLSEEAGKSLSNLEIDEIVYGQ